MCKRVKEETDHSMPLPVAFGDAIACDCDFLWCRDTLAIAEL